MSVGIVKESKYEILAILREEYRVKSELDIYYNGEPWASGISKVDFTSFYINQYDSVFSSIPEGEPLYFVLHSPLGKIEFCTRLNPEPSSASSGTSLAFLLPDTLTILQRRVTQRVDVKNEYGFFCAGRHRSGENYKCVINDLSEGGCSFVSNTFNKKFMQQGMSLDNVEISLAEYGSITASLKVVSVIPVTQDSIQDRETFRISCKFNYKNPDFKKNMEDIILKITVDQKLKSRRLIS